eukprot:COSAG01_NODE_58229_length_307_cov_0.903846_1_plen_40_part_01
MRISDCLGDFVALTRPQLLLRGQFVVGLLPFFSRRLTADK